MIQASSSSSYDGSNFRPSRQFSAFMDIATAAHRPTSAALRMGITRYALLLLSPLLSFSVGRESLFHIISTPSLSLLPRYHYLPLPISLPSAQVWNLAKDPAHNDAIVAVMTLRESLRGYISALSKEAATTGMPLMRAMVLAFPGDAGAQGTDVEDQFMLGDAWLVGPVTTYRATSRSIYLPVPPAGSTWQYYFNKVRAVTPLC